MHLCTLDIQAASLAAVSFPVHHKWPGALPRQITSLRIWQTIAYRLTKRGESAVRYATAVSDPPSASPRSLGESAIRAARLRASRFSWLRRCITASAVHAQCRSRGTFWRLNSSAVSRHVRPRRWASSSARRWIASSCGRRSSWSDSVFSTALRVQRRPSGVREPDAFSRGDPSESRHPFRIDGSDAHPY